MALDIQPPNYSGLAAIASGNNNLNLSVPGALGLQAAQVRQQQMESIRNAALAQAQLQQQGQLALMENQRQRQEMAQTGAYQQGLLSNAARGQDITAQGQMMDARQNDIENAYKQQALQQTGALGQGNLDIQRQQLIQDQQAKIMAKLLDEKKESIKEKGALAAYGLSAIKQAKTPEEAQMIRNELLTEAVDKKMLTETQAKMLRTSPLSQFTNFLTHSVMTFDAVDKYKKMMDANKKQKSATSGVNLSVSPDGSIQYSSTPTISNETKLQGDLTDRELALQQLAPLRNDFKSKYFTYQNQAGVGASKIAEMSKGIPGLEQATDFIAEKLTGKGAEDRAQLIRDTTKYLNAVEQFFQTKYRKPITGAGAGLDEIKDLRKAFMNKDMSPSEVLGSLDQIIANYTSEAEFNKNVLNKGIDTTPSNDEGLRKAFKAAGKTDAEIDAWFKSRGK